MTKIQYTPIDFEDIMKKTMEFQRTIEKVSEYLGSYKTLDVNCFILEPKQRKESLACTLNDTSVNNSLNESGDDENDTSILECLKSLNEKISDLCARSKDTLRLEYFEENHYIFQACCNLLVIMVEIHPEDSYVIDIQCDSCVKESADAIIHFIAYNIKQNLELTNLKSYLGQYYDILSLLDYICMTVEEFDKFHVEFISLQQEYMTLKMHNDFRVSFEILCCHPPIWWAISLKLSASKKILAEDLVVQVHAGKINADQIKQMARDTDEGLNSLRVFIRSTVDYFNRTQLKFRKKV